MKRAYYYIGAVVIGILCLVLRWPRVQKEHEINKLKLEKDNITAQIEVLSWELNKLSNTRVLLLRKKCVKDELRCYKRWDWRTKNNNQMNRFKIDGYVRFTLKSRQRKYRSYEVSMWEST